MAIAFIDLKAQRRRIGPKMDAAIMAAVEAAQYILGPQVREFEQKLAAYGEAKLALSCANGTDALVIPLRAWGIGPGDAVFCPSFTFTATAEVVPWLGATPVFVDILPDTYNIDPAHLEAAIEMVAREGKMKPKAIIAVDLFGQPADYPAIAKIAQKHGLKLIADSAQGFGCTLNSKHPLHWADVTATSFYPAKPLGCYGDGGAVLTNDAAMWELMDSVRIHGKAVASDTQGRSFDHDPKYLNFRIGMNSRLDTIQAAILLQKLEVFAEEITLRNRVADRYAEGLKDAVTTPTVIAGGVSTWAQYTVEANDRDGFQVRLREKGVPTAVYYPVPLHQQACYAQYPQGPGGLPVTEAKAHVVISLPMHPDLDAATQDQIIAAVRAST